MKPGDVLIFHRHTLHTSRPNLSDTLRLSLDMRFFGAEDRTQKHYLDVQRMEVFEPFSGEQHVRV
jgi:ectoine hydroxylase-related dioxygenase (phytanoyl-CoA dioxygenase family)